MYEILEGLNRTWQPHGGQIPIGQDLFYRGQKNIFVCAGRNFGKTEFAAYSNWRWALSNPGTQNYIFEPFQKQAREILWASGRIQDFGPKDWVSDINNTELRITFKNGSFIKLEGSDNVAAIAGIKPKGLITYDEFKDHRLASIRNFEPNRAAFDVPALFIGTPPEIHNHFVDYMDMAKKLKTWSFHHAPTSTNPHISKRWLDEMRSQLIGMGEEEEWLRSYEAVFVKGGKRSIFPWILSAKFPPLEETLPRDLNKWQLIVAFDPASTSVFGVVFALFEPYSKRIIAFDELYLEKHEEMTARSVRDAVEAKLAPYRGKVRGLTMVYDEAAAWFRNEMIEIDHSWTLEPTQKQRFGVDGYIGLVRSVMRYGLLTICNTCPKLIWEIENYVKDENGKVPKVNDHNINALEYLCGALGLNFDEIDRPKPEQRLPVRAYRPEDDLGIDEMTEI